VAPTTGDTEFDVGRRFDELMTWARRSATLVAARRRIGRYVVGDVCWRVLDGLPAFRPNSEGDRQALAGLTMLAAHQTVPLMLQLLEHADGDVLALTDIETYGSSSRHRDDLELLGSLFDRYGSDKAGDHNYHLFYAGAFDDRCKVRSVLEIGVGTNNPSIVSTMGRAGRPGASLRAFREFFPSAHIFGADVDRGILFGEDRIDTCYVDQTDQASFAALSDLTGGDLDLIIDDGLHAPNANLAVLVYALDHLAVGGWVVIEDIAAEAVPLWQVVGALMPSAYACKLLQARAGVVFAARRIG
jgi:Methyltransferase domain